MQHLVHGSPLVALCTAVGYVVQALVRQENEDRDTKEQAERKLQVATHGSKRRPQYRNIVASADQEDPPNRPPKFFPG
jgi:hypothetical protein